jgi:hypothetical protein
MREQLANRKTSALTTGIDGSQTTLTVDNGSAFPATGNFTLICESEVMHCTARSGNTLTVVRGIDGTSATSHGDSSIVTMVITAESLGRVAGDNVSLWGACPPLGKLLADDGSLLTASDWTWLNQGSATLTDQAGTTLLTVPTASGENVRGLLRSAPSTPYSYQAAFRHVGFRQGNTSIPYLALGLRQSSSGRFTTLTFLQDAQSEARLMVNNWTSPTGSASTVLSRSNLGNIGSELWMRADDNGTNISFHLGDGVNWFQVYSVSRTSHMTTTGPDQVMWLGSAFNSGSAWPYLVRLMHWSKRA